MRVVLDTNVLLVSIARKSIYRPIFDALLEGRFELVISNEILSEYVEIIGQRANPIVASNIAEMLLSLKNLHKVDVYFEWRLIEGDEDDNKYVDAAVTGGVDCIVSNDAHFKVL
ncbi:putative toxin-antitoxin system toxin component, PIN family [Olivibacter sitiensis]|uniref:putative toxin-antitoxin system toxin component, PIN family n=1 Tax=Olivibacter sitiensis TaxID=376470 RepID=UPI000416090D|nr:putative toxin-antitoxin system toxin component, PIN family [Olivibacter sitiensis]